MNETLKTLWNQISLSSKMMLGWRDAVYSNEDNTLSFRYTCPMARKSLAKIQIKYNPDDTYSIYWFVYRRNLSIKWHGVYHNVMVDTLNERLQDLAFEKVYSE